MSPTNLILLHPPSIYDFRKEHQMFGPISDVVPSSSIFEMYPIGFMIMHGYLQQYGFSVRIINVALKMLKSKRFDVEKLIKSLNTAAFGIDLHWLTHAQGSLALAEIIKKYHPDTPVIFGGLSSSYFHRELLEYPQVDYVLRGDSVEEPLAQLLASIKTGRTVDNIPNLTWRDSSGNVVENKLSHSPPNLNYYPFDYRKIIKSTIRHIDIIGHLPFHKWLKYPIVAMLPWKGCVHNCIICGGSAHFYNKYCGRKQPAYRSPELVANDIALVAKYLKGPIILLGDLRQGGEGYAQELFERIRVARIKNHIAIELFNAAPRSYFEQMARAIPNFNIEISPESHDEEVRKTFGRQYDNKGLEESMRYALELGCRRFDLFFMIGLSRQTPQSVQETVDYCDYLIKKFKRFGIGRVLPFISPLAPFLDPGSLAFENPKKYGFKQIYRTFEEHRQALLQPSWKYMLSYETKWMSRDDIVTSTYKAAIRLNRIKARHGIISQKEAQNLEALINEAQNQVERIDTIVQVEEREKRNSLLKLYKNETKKLSIATICKKDELNWPLKMIRFNPVSLLQALFD